MAELCVTLARRRHQRLFEEMEAAYAQGARWLEIRLDYLSGDPRLDEILAHKRGPLTATVRRTQDGGQWRHSEESRRQLLRRAIALGFDYVDLEDDVAASIPRFGNTRRIVSSHDLSGMPVDLWELFARLRDQDADIVKIAAMAKHPCHNFQMFDLLRRVDVPTVAFCMGELGLPSRVLGAKFGAPFAYAAFNPLRLVAPGMLTFAEMRELFHCETIGRSTDVLGVIGDPISHSLSPLVHNTCFHRLGLNRVYLPFHVKPDELPEFMRSLGSAEIKGLSVTLPHKQEILRYGEAGDDLVGASRSANTVILRGGRLLLYNTDGPAAVSAVSEVLPPDPESVGQTLNGRSVLVLGAGGVARTIAHALFEQGAIVTIANRTEQRASGLARSIGCNTISWTQRHAKHYDVVMNCTTVGMTPNIDASPFHQSALNEGMVVFDAVYTPENTVLVRQAHERGCRVVTGVAMFVRQAEAQFRLFTGMDPPADLIVQLVREELSPGRNMLRQARLSAAQSAEAAAE